MKANGILQFSEKSREELIETILQQQKEIEELRKKLRANERVDDQRKLLKLMRMSQRVEHPKTPGRKAGHVGVTRMKPRTIDRVVELELTHCPDCHHQVGESQGVVEHIQEDIVPAHVEATCFRKHRYWCPQWHSVKLSWRSPDAIPSVLF